MGNRVRLGELLAAIGVIGLGVLLTQTHWFTAAVSYDLIQDGGGAKAAGNVNLDAGLLGWVTSAFLIASLVAGFVFLARVLTGRGPERAALQAPIAFTVGKVAALVLFLRLVVFTPEATVDDVRAALPSTTGLSNFVADVSVATVGWLGLVAALLIPIGAWIAMADERTGSAASKRSTAELLADVPVRPVPHVPAPPYPDASVIADDAIGTDPSSPASGGPA